VEGAHVNRRKFVQWGAASLVPFCVSGSPAAGPQAEILYNGIRLPSPWPPVRALSREPMAVPYLVAPPAVIPIDLGRQLFVDNFLIEQTSLRRTFHQASYHPATPVLRPDQPWERTGAGPTAMVFSDGVWFDPADNLFKMWYMGGHTCSTCYAVSRDGIRWEKPRLDVRPGTNIVHSGFRDSCTVWLDLNETDPKKRFKMFRSVRADREWALDVHFSADGIHWSNVVQSGLCGDRTTVFYNPFRRVWVYSIRSNDRRLGRTRSYVENRQVEAGARWKTDEPLFWVGADRLDPERKDLRTECQLYNLDAVAYESVLLGLFSIWRGQPRDRAKPNEIVLGFSRDGFHWDRPDRRAFCPVSERFGDWNWGNVQSAGGGCLIVGDQLYFYVSGRAGIRGAPTSGACSTGLATLRRDGFASMDAGTGAGSLTTRPVRFRGRFLFVNVDAPRGELRVEILDAHNQVFPAFSRTNCTPIQTNGTIRQVQWKGGPDVSVLRGQSVKFRFYLRNGRLYSFWISPEATGASHGYVAAGGPRFKGIRDVVGEAG
jgi:hypothetical protein